MKPKHEIYGNLARLLATENLDIIHKNVETASFNVETRTLTLPIWEKASDTVYQLLLSHEAGHAIYTSTEDWSELTDVPMQFLNVTEDVRIEKLMKRRYPGLKKTFFNGYKELNDDDFFGISEDDISEYNFADKVNLYFKIGNFINLSFTDVETQIIDQIQEAETFIDAVRAAEVLYEYCKNEEKENMEKIKIDLNQSSSVSSEIDNNHTPSESQKVDSESLDEERIENSSNNLDSTSGESDQKEKTQNGDYDSSLSSNYIKTANSFAKAVNRLTETDFREIVYLEVPKINLDKVVVSPKKIHSLCKKYWETHSDNSDFTVVDSDYSKFKISAKKEVNYLVKEFECKKAADAYSKSSESKTGVLDCSSLHSYKYNEDIFKKLITVPEGKNHGLIFILDWSGSMDTVILETCRQLFNLIWFCKRVSIPFEVYAFTNSWSYSYGKGGEVAANTLQIDGNFNLLNLISSSCNSTTLEQHLKNIYRLAYAFTKGGYSYSTPSQLTLSGTPLNESILSLHEIIPHFQKKTKVQKVQCVVLTDGEASALNRYCQYQDRLTTATIGDNCFLRDKKLKTTYSFPRYSYYASHKFTDVLLKHLKDVFPSVNFIGIRLLSNGEIVSFVKQHMEDCTDDQHSKIMSDWRKYKSCALTLSGYDCYFGIHSSSLGNNTQFEVNESSSIVDIRNAFKKSLQSKKMNKKILSQFVDLIA